MIKKIKELPPGTKESNLKLDIPELKDFIPAKMIHALLRNCSVYQFHDTSSTSKIRNSGYINQSDFLYSDGGNLAAFLYGLKENEKNKPYYEKIVRHIKQVFPQFGDFSLQPNTRNDNYIILDWYEQSNVRYKLGAHQLSDGTIRFMALAALLLQPPKNLPSVIVLDEPELGLHPSAIVELASMVKMASQHTQVVLATQSPALLDEFEPKQITVIERDPISKSSVFKRFTEEDLKVWLEDYTLSEIWDKNILGGKP
jgi:predicted ATPase